jgi:hypothetical protein
MRDRRQTSCSSKRTASAPTVSAVLLLTARCHHTVRRRCMKSDCMGIPYSIMHVSVNERNPRFPSTAFPANNITIHIHRRLHVGVHNAVVYPSQKASGSVSLLTDCRIAGEDCESRWIAQQIGKQSGHSSACPHHHHPRVHNVRI